MLGLVTLDDHRTRHLLASRTTAHLRHNLEGALKSPEVGETDEIVGTQHPDHRHAVEIQTLCNHLSTNKNISLVLLKIGDDFLVTVFGTGGVHIHALDDRVGKQFRKLVLNFLGAKALHLHVNAIARRACGRHINGIAAVMALQQTAALVVGERHITVLTLG